MSDQTYLFLGKMSASIGLALLMVGLMLALPVMFASDMGLDRSDLARFFGAMFGSIMAVGGAIVVFFLKEARDTQRALGFVGSALKNLKKQCADAAEEYDENSDEDRRRRLAFIFAEFRRTAEICKRFEFEHIRISNANFWLEELRNEIDFDDLRRELDDMPSEKIQILLNVMKSVSETTVTAFHYREFRDWIEPI